LTTGTGDRGTGTGECSKKKHPCPDCRFCQECGEDRCRLCRGEGQKPRRKLSLAEQIALYEEINRREKCGET
jgi:hypothetical protein